MANVSSDAREDASHSGDARHAEAAARAAREATLRHLEQRVARDPADYVAHAKLAQHHLQSLREKRTITYLDLARKAALASLDAEPAELNLAGLGVLAQVELAAHEFAAARDHARRLIELGSDGGYAHQVLGDALFELGEYDEAEQAYEIMAERADPTRGSQLDVEARFAQLERVRGNLTGARERFAGALEHAVGASPRVAERVAWCQWQLGETAFLAGDYSTAERAARQALSELPTYAPATALLGRALAARGDLRGAIATYEWLAENEPGVSSLATLGDLYAASGREQESQAKYRLARQLGDADAEQGSRHGREFQLFRAEHEVDVAGAYADAQREYALRRDVYSADALAWTAFKAGRLDEAQLAMEEALRTGTKDARLLYHAGLIARATGDPVTARARLEEALRLSPEFDQIQAHEARRVLTQLRLERAG